MARRRRGFDKIIAGTPMRDPGRRRRYRLISVEEHEVIEEILGAPVLEPDPNDAGEVWLGEELADPDQDEDASR